MRACVRVCVRACVCACVCVCVRACVLPQARAYVYKARVCLSVGGGGGGRVLSDLRL